MALGITIVSELEIMVIKWLITELFLTGMEKK